MRITPFIVAMSMALLACNHEKRLKVYLVPCDNSFAYKNAGTLNGVSLTRYYSISEKISLKKMLDSLQLIVEEEIAQANLRQISMLTVYFLSDDQELRKIVDCKTANWFDLQSTSKHKPVAVYSYDTTSHRIQRALFNDKGEFVSNSYSSISQ